MKPLFPTWIACLLCSAASADTLFQTQFGNIPTGSPDGIVLSANLDIYTYPVNSLGIGISGATHTHYNSTPSETGSLYLTNSGTQYLAVWGPMKATNAKTAFLYSFTCDVADSAPATLSSLSIDGITTFNTGKNNTVNAVNGTYNGVTVTLTGINKTTGLEQSIASNTFNLAFAGGLCTTDVTLDLNKADIADFSSITATITGPANSNTAAYNAFGSSKFGFSGLTLNGTLVPEPSAAAFGLLGMASLLLRRRRRA